MGVIHISTRNTRSMNFILVEHAVRRTRKPARCLNSRATTGKPGGGGGVKGTRCPNDVRVSLMEESMRRQHVFP